MRSRPGRSIQGIVGFRQLIGLVLLALSGISGCQDPAESSLPAVTIEDGVAHVRNPGTPLWGDTYRPFRQAEVLGANLGNGGVTFARPITVSTGPDGTRYVLDSFGPTVYMLDPSGTMVRAVGRNGEGPGEFAVPTDLLVDADGSFSVLDPGNFRISHFDATGEFQGMAKTEVFLSQFEPAGDGSFFAYPRNRTPASRTLGHEIGKDISQVSVLNAAGETVSAFATRYEHTGEMADIYVNKLFLASLQEDSLLISYQGLDRTEVWSADGVLARVIHRPLPFEPNPPLYEERDRTPGSGPSVGWEYDVFSSGLAVDPTGSYWAVLVPQGTARMRTPLFGEPEIPEFWSIELFDRDGRWLSRQPLDIPCKDAVLDWGTDGLYLLNMFEDAAVYRFEFHPSEM